MPLNQGKYKIIAMPQQWECPECGAWNDQAMNPGGRGPGWHDCPNCGHREGPQPRDYSLRETEEPDTDHYAKYRVVALGEMQQPGAVGATQMTGPTGSDPQMDENQNEPGISTDAGENSFEQNVALETWVNFAVDMLNRGKPEQEVLAQLSHDGCPDPKAVLQRALEQPEESPVPNDFAEDPFDVPYRDEQTSNEESLSHQPPVNQSVAHLWDNADHRRIVRASDANDLGGPIGESADDHAPKKPEDNIFDVAEPSGEDQADLFDVDEPEATDNHVPPIEFKDEVPVQDTKDVHKSNLVRIAGTSWKGHVLEEWEDLWGQKLVRVALSDGGTVNVAPTQLTADDPGQQEHPVTQIEQFISALEPVDATRPSILARLANLEIVRRAVRAQISKVGFSDQLRLEQLDRNAADQTRELREILPTIRSEQDRQYLASQPKYRSGDGTQLQDPAFNEKIAERAAIFVEELAPEVREDAEGLVYAAAKFAERNNGNVPEFVKAAQKYAGGYDDFIPSDDPSVRELMEGPGASQSETMTKARLCPDCGSARVDPTTPCEQCGSKHPGVTTY